MKKITLGIFIGFLLAFPFTAFGQSTLKEIKAYLRPDLPIKINGYQIDIKKPPIIYNGTTYLPLAELGSIFNASVRWNDVEKSVEIESMYPVDIDVKMTDKILNQVHNDVFYNIDDIQKKLREKYEIPIDPKALVRTSVKNSRIVIIYDEKEYYPIENVDRYYDRLHEKTYYSKTFLSQFIDQDILESIPKYHVNLITKTVTQIK